MPASQPPPEATITASAKAAKYSAKINGDDVIVGYWGSSKGGVHPPGQVFGCTSGAEGLIVTCVGVNVNLTDFPSVDGTGYRTKKGTCKFSKRREFIRRDIKDAFTPPKQTPLTDTLLITGTV